MTSIRRGRLGGWGGYLLFLAFSSDHADKSPNRTEQSAVGHTFIRRCCSPLPLQEQRDWNGTQVCRCAGVLTPDLLSAPLCGSELLIECFCLCYTTYGFCTRCFLFNLYWVFSCGPAGYSSVLNRLQSCCCFLIPPSLLCIVAVSDSRALQTSNQPKPFLTLQQWLEGSNRLQHVILYNNNNLPFSSLGVLLWLKIFISK